MTKLKTFFLLSILTFGLAGCGDAAPGNASTASDKASIRLEVATSAQSIAPGQVVVSAKPKIIDFGSKKCQACKAMEPVLESLGANQADKFITEFVDVWVPENQKLAMAHEISSIPTQVFFDAEGKEVYRHTGFISEEDVLAKWTELGLISNAPASVTASESAVATDTATTEPK